MRAWAVREPNKFYMEVVQDQDTQYSGDDLLQYTECTHAPMVSLTGVLTKNSNPQMADLYRCKHCNESTSHKPS